MEPPAFHLRRASPAAAKTADRQGEPDADGLREPDSDARACEPIAYTHHDSCARVPVLLGLVVSVQTDTHVCQSGK